MWQLTEQSPTAFEFNSRFLRTLVYHTTSCKFGTFLCDCVRQRLSLGLPSLTRSVWEALEGVELVNPRFEPTDQVCFLKGAKLISLSRSDLSSASARCSYCNQSLGPEHSSHGSHSIAAPRTRPVPCPNRRLPSEGAESSQGTCDASR